MSRTEWSHFSGTFSFLVMKKARDASDEYRRQSDGHWQSELGNPFYNVTMNTGDVMNFMPDVAKIPSSFKIAYFISNCSCVCVCV